MEVEQIRKPAIWLMIASIAIVSIVSLIFGGRVLLKNMWDFLVVSEQPVPSDVIIVLSGGTDRVTYGVSLFQAGYADKMLFSGGVADNMKQQAISLGIPADHILLEEKSGTTYTNAKYSLEVMREQGFKSAIVVSSPYHTRRVSIIFSRFFRGLDLTVSAPPYDPSISTNWWKGRHTAMLVISEYMKIVYYYLFQVYS